MRHADVCAQSFIPLELNHSMRFYKAFSLLIDIFSPADRERSRSLKSSIIPHLFERLKLCAFFTAVEQHRAKDSSDFVHYAGRGGTGIPSARK